LTIVLVAACGLGIPHAAAAPAPQSGPATTTVTDTVYQADGSAAKGNLIISWPAFVTASGAQVASGTTNTALASNGTFSVGLVPNAGAVPAGAYYTVVYQIGPAVAAREIVDPVRFRDGISKIVDGTVECLNASTWAKQSSQEAAGHPQG
jgi:hypothetical protein